MSLDFGLDCNRAPGEKLMCVKAQRAMELLPDSISLSVTVIGIVESDGETIKDLQYFTCNSTLPSPVSTHWEKSSNSEGSQQQGSKISRAKLCCNLQPSIPDNDVNPLLEITDDTAMDKSELKMNSSSPLSPSLNGEEMRFGPFDSINTFKNGEHSIAIEESSPLTFKAALKSTNVEYQSLGKGPTIPGELPLFESLVMEPTLMFSGANTFGTERSTPTRLSTCTPPSDNRKMELSGVSCENPSPTSALTDLFPNIPPCSPKIEKDAKEGNQVEFSAVFCLGLVLSPAVDSAQSLTKCIPVGDIALSLTRSHILKLLSGNMYQNSDCTQQAEGLLLDLPIESLEVNDMLFAEKNKSNTEEIQIFENVVGQDECNKESSHACDENTLKKKTEKKLLIRTRVVSNNSPITYPCSDSIQINIEKGLIAEVVASQNVNDENDPRMTRDNVKPNEVEPNFFCSLWDVMDTVFESMKYCEDDEENVFANDLSVATTFETVETADIACYDEAYLSQYRNIELL